MGNVILPLAIVIVILIAYLIPLKRKKCDQIANTRIQDRFSSRMRVLDTSSRSLNGASQCSGGRILTQPINVEKTLKTKRKQASDMTSSKAMAMRAKQMRMLSALKAQHVANVSKRQARARVRLAGIAVAALSSFALLGVYMASLISLYWLSLPIVATAVLVAYNAHCSKADLKTELAEKKRIIALQTKLSAKRPVKTKSNNAVKVMVSNYNSQLNSQLQVAQEADEVVENYAQNIQQNSEKLNSSASGAKVTLQNTIPAPMYARVAAQEAINPKVATHEDITPEQNKPQGNKKRVVAPKTGEVKDSKQLSQQTGFDLEKIIRSRTAG